jgi:DNA end-binding protein Ku
LRIPACGILRDGPRARRALWTGSIAFGLVNIPIRVYSAVHEHRKPVPDDEIVEAYEVSRGRLVHLTDDDFETLRVEGARAIELQDFVP